MALTTLPSLQRSVVPHVRKSYAKIPDVLEVPNLIQVQIDSFEWFKREGLRELFNEINPITDFSGNRMELRFLDYEFKEPSTPRLNTALET